MSTTSTSTTDKPTHRLLRAVGKIPNGTVGHVREAGCGPTVGDMPERETDISNTHARYPYVFTPDPGGADASSAGAFKFASRGFLVAEAEVVAL